MKQTEAYRTDIFLKEIVLAILLNTFKDEDETDVVEHLKSLKKIKDSDKIIATLARYKEDVKTVLLFHLLMKEYNMPEPSKECYESCRASVELIIEYGESYFNSVTVYELFCNYISDNLVRLRVTTLHYIRDLLDYLPEKMYAERDSFHKVIGAMEG